MLVPSRSLLFAKTTHFPRPPIVITISALSGLLYQMLCEVCKATLASAIFEDPEKHQKHEYLDGVVILRRYRNLQSFQKAKDNECYICYLLFNANPVIGNVGVRDMSPLVACSGRKLRRRVGA